ncbi:MAG TPA: hypothetical protein DEQ02_06015 [Ruminococcaceae bacterium]|nr:hypothetical protein [Oscillospiraceae bacterium]
MASEFDRREIERMQAEAVRRVREMQARANQTQSGGYQTTPHSPPKANPRPQQHSPPSKKPPPRNPLGGLFPSLFGGGGHPGQGGHSGEGPKKGGLDILKMFNLKEFNMDSDRTLILMMLVLFSGETSDELLMLALLYIML